MSEKLVTKKQRRDKESNAESHRKKISGKRSSIEGVTCPFGFLVAAS
jgi:hypothetical protein